MAQNKVAVVTGAGSGIGRRTALALVKAGWRVALAGRTQGALQATAEAAADPEAVLVVPTDVTQEASVDALFAAAVAKWGRVDLLFNNAGTFYGSGPIEDIPAKAWRDMVDVNLTGSFLCAQAAFRQMKNQSPQGGRIINNGSISAHAPRPNAVGYTATKHAITGLTKSISLEGRRYAVACGQIDIGNAATDMTKNMATGMLQANFEMAPEPTMNADHVADAVVYMAGLPLEANVLFMTVMASAMPFVGRG